MALTDLHRLYCSLPVASRTSSVRQNESQSQLRTRLGKRLRSPVTYGLELIGKYLLGRGEANGHITGR